MIDLAERVPGGLGDVRRPLLSASDDDTPSALFRGDTETRSGSTAEDGGRDSDLGGAPDVAPGDDSGGFVIVTEIAETERSDTGSTGTADAADAAPDTDTGSGPDDVAEVTGAANEVSPEDPWGDRGSSVDDPTEAIPMAPADDDQAPERDESGEEFRFSFDDERS